LVPLESMACCTPVVGIPEAGIRESVQHGETGLLTERDPVEYGQAIEMLLRDDALREKMGAAGRRRVVDRWTWEGSVEQLERNMRYAVERRGSVVE